MSVYTQLEPSDIQSILDQYAQGQLLEYHGIAAGIENTNYFVTATSADREQEKREFVLTVFETTSSANLSAYFDLMAQLAARDLPVAEPYKNARGLYVCELENKPAALIERLPGNSVTAPNQYQCAEIGRFLAGMHEISMPGKQQLMNTRGAEWRGKILARLLEAGIEHDNHLLAASHESVSEFEQADLPRGIVHGDLFHDNALFLLDELTGVIDFYYAHSAPLIYDLAVCVADWCYVQNGGDFDEDNAKALIAGYREIRAISGAEVKSWATSLELVGLRFYLSRFHDKHFPRAGVMTQEKDPDVFLDLLKLARNNPTRLHSMLGD